MAKKPEPFHNPFKGLKLEKPAPPKAKTEASPSKPQAPARPVRSAEEDEAEFFRRSVGAVDRVARGPKVVTSGPPPTDAIKLRREDDEVLEELALLVAGDGPFQLTRDAGLVQGSVNGLDARILRRLRAGEWAVQGVLDLHGMLRAEAKPAVEKFITTSRRAEKRCVLVVHGRGLHSESQVPVLKEEVPLWLSQGRLSRDVLAFCTARPEDGGQGALYVLLRK